MINHISWYFLILFFLLGGIVSFLYYRFLWYTLRKMNGYKRKGLYLFYTTFVRLTLFVLLTFLITDFRPEKFIWYILGFIIIRFFVVHAIGKGKK